MSESEIKLWPVKLRRPIYLACPVCEQIFRRGNSVILSVAGNYIDGILRDSGTDHCGKVRFGPIILPTLDDANTYVRALARSNPDVLTIAPISDLEGILERQDLSLTEVQKMYKDYHQVETELSKVILPLPGYVPVWQ